jgi:gas vesicle protein
MADKKKKHDLLTGIVVGGAVGSVLSLLLSSKENREKSKKIGLNIFKKGKSVAESFLEKYDKEK